MLTRDSGPAGAPKVTLPFVASLTCPQGMAGD